MTADAIRLTRGRSALIVGAAWVLLYFASRALLERDDLATSVRVGVALAPVPVFVAFLWTYLRLVRTADELERRVHLEALGVAFPLTLLLLTTLALLQRAITLPFEDWSYAHVAWFLPIFYLLGLSVAWRRYR